MRGFLIDSTSGTPNRTLLSLTSQPTPAISGSASRNRNTVSPKLWMDAYLAAFAISGKLRFVTNDKAFRQFQAYGLDLHLLTA